MKILHIALHFSEYSLSLSKALAEKHQVICVLSEDNARAELLSADLQVVSSNMQVKLLKKGGLKNPLSLVINAVNIVILARQFMPDVIHCQEAVRDYLMLSLPFLRSFPLVVTTHDPTPHSGHDSLERRRNTFYRKWLRKSADCVVVHGKLLQATASEVMPWMAGRIFSVAHGVLGRVQQDAPEFIDAENYILFFGRIERYKGLGYLLDALDILDDKGVQPLVVIAGCGSDLDNHRARIYKCAKYRLIDRFLSPEEVTPLFRRAKLVVMPYTDATQSGVAALALTHGLPIIATDVGSIPEMVRDSVNGILVPPSDANSLAHAIKKLLTDEKLYSSLKAGAIKLASSEFSWLKIASETEEVYRVAICHRK